MLIGPRIRAKCKIGFLKSDAREIAVYVQYVQYTLHIIVRHLVRTYSNGNVTIAHFSSINTNYVGLLYEAKTTLTLIDSIAYGHCQNSSIVVGSSDSSDMLERFFTEAVCGVD